MLWMRHKDFARWLQRRQQGPWVFVLRQGMLLYGLPMFVIMSLLMHRDGQPYWLLGVSLLLWLSGGALFGWLLWLVNEWRFRKVLQRAERRSGQHGADEG